MVKSSPPTTPLRAVLRPVPGEKLARVDSGRGDGAQVAVAVIDAHPGQRPDLVDRAVIEQHRQALTHREPAGVMLTADLARPAHPLGQLAPPAYLVKFRLPRHNHRR